MSGTWNIPTPQNEPVLSYAPGSPERAALKAALAAVGAQQADIPAVVGGREVRSGVTHDVVAPHCHQRVLAKKRKLDLHVRTVPYVPGTKRLYVAPPGAIDTLARSHCALVDHRKRGY